MNAVIEDEAVVEVVEEEVDEVVESVDADEDSEETETDITESEESAKDEEKPEPSESSAEKKEDGFQKRIDELTTRYYQEKQQKEHFQKQWEDSQQAEPVQEPGKTLRDFEYDETKFAEYLQGQAVATAKAEIERGNQKNEEMQRRASFEAKEALFAKTVDDYEKIAHHSPITPHVAGIVMGAEKAPELAYYLGKNPELAVSLSEMHPIDAARELGRIEATKLVKPEPSTKKPPVVVPKIKATDSGATRVRSDTPESDKLSTEEWKRREIKRMANRNK